MPVSTQGDLEDGNVISFIEKSVNPDKNESKLIKTNKKVVKKVNIGMSDETTFLIREMDKKLKRTINDKVAAMIKSDKKLSSITIPKDEIYSKLAHKMFEVQDNHKLYKGTATNQVYDQGKSIKEINDDSKLLILYLCNLILFSKKSDAVKTIDEYGKYFYDKSLSEANIRKLRALALIRNKKDNNFDNATEAVKEFLKAKVLFQNNESHHGTAICCAGVGFILYEIFIHYVRSTNSLLKYAKKTFVEALLHYEAINHTYAKAFCYDMLQDIKRSIKEDCTVEYKNYILLQRKLKQEIDNETTTFIERVQGAEMSLFIENVYTASSTSIQNSNINGGDADNLAKQIMERKKLIEKFEKDHQTEESNFMNNVIGGNSEETEFSAYSSSTKDTKNTTRIRHSVDVKEDVAFKKIIKNLPSFAKSGGKIRDRIRESISINPQSFINESGFFMSPTSNSNLPKNLLEKAFNQLKYKKTKTLHTEDNDSDEFEFCKSSRKYKDLNRIKYNESAPLMDDVSNQVSITSPIMSNAKNIGKYESTTIVPREDNDSQMKRSINWGNFYNQTIQRKSPTLQLKYQSNANAIHITGMAKRRKFQMKQLKSVASQQSNRYSVSRIDSNLTTQKGSLIRDFINKTPSINIMPLKGLKENILKVSVMSSTVKKMQE